MAQRVEPEDSLDDFPTPPWATRALLTHIINNERLSKLTCLEPACNRGFMSEPLKEFFKDEVRVLGDSLGLNKNICYRHPFPGPGLGIRIIGNITLEKIKILQEADYIFINELNKNNLYDKIWQAYAALLPIKTVGVMGDSRTYEYTCLLRAVTSEDGMTADYFNFPKDFLDKISNKIINKVRGINRVVYDISSKPPSTIELE